MRVKRYMLKEDTLFYYITLPTFSTGACGWLIARNVDLWWPFNGENTKTDHHQRPSPPASVNNAVFEIYSKIVDDCWINLKYNSRIKVISAPLIFLITNFFTLRRTKRHPVFSHCLRRPSPGSVLNHRVWPQLRWEPQTHARSSGPTTHSRPENQTKPKLARKEYANVFHRNKSFKI